jgi:hypothetical protein
MLNDPKTSYRWQDHVISPKRVPLNLVATVLIVATVFAVGLHGDHHPDPVLATHVAAATERTPSLANLVKRHVSAHLRLELLKGC